MKNTVKVLLFLAILALLFYLTNTYEYILSGFFGYLSIVDHLNSDRDWFCYLSGKSSSNPNLNMACRFRGFSVTGIYFLSFIWEKLS